MKLGSYHATIHIDHPATGVRRAVRLKIKRFTVDEGTRFARDYHRSANPPSAVMLARHDVPDEQAQKIVKVATKPGEQDDLAYIVPDADIAKRRLSEMSPEQRALYDRLDAEEEAFSATFIMDTLQKYVRVLPGQDLETVDDFEDDDAAPRTVKTGADLAAVFGGREDIVTNLIRIVHLENAYTEAAKKVGADCRACQRAGLCRDRGCGPEHDGSVVWIGSNGLEATRCPVIDLAANREAMHAFDVCYAPVVEPFSGFAHYDRRSLPFGGGVQEQPAQLMAALEFIEGIARDELQEDVEHHRREATPKEPAAQTT